MNLIVFAVKTIRKPLIEWQGIDYSCYPPLYVYSVRYQV